MYLYLSILAGKLLLSISNAITSLGQFGLAETGTVRQACIAQGKLINY